MIYSADYVLPVSSEPIAQGGILVRDGEIIAVGRELKRLYPNEQVREFPGCAILPGFVNCHTHIELTAFRGCFDGLDFMDWLRAMGESVRTTPPEVFRQGAEAACTELILGGVTTLGDISTTGISAEVINQSGLRAVVFREITAFRADDEGFRRVRNVFDSLPQHSRLITFGISPHALYTVAPPLLELSAQLARERSIRLAVHIAESEIETEFVAGHGDLAEFYNSQGIPWSPYPGTPVEYLHQQGLLSPNTIAVHCVQVSDEDLDLVASSGASISHCPKSNARLGHGIAPVRDMIDRGINVGLGTDSAVSNDKLDMFEEMRAAVLFARASKRDLAAMSAAEALKMATMGGATMLGLADHIGSLEPGKGADFIAVELPPASNLAPAWRYDPIKNLVFQCGPEHVRFAAVDGRQLVG